MPGETALWMQQVESAQLQWRVLKDSPPPLPENPIWFLKIFAANIELEQKIKFAQVHTWFSVI